MGKKTNQKKPAAPAAKPETLADALELTAAPAPAKKEEVKAEKPKAAATVVRDAGGTPMYRKMTPTLVQADPVRKARTPASYKAPSKQTQSNIETNPALLSFPTDRFGLTREVRKALLTASSRVLGDPVKKALMDETLTILIKHMNAKFEIDSARRKAASEVVKG